ncbi:hypothetical protein, partial [Bradyrhizobium yuanmingense]|uniref:hypothetical protein n=1 Tax=Bradyrhizobium yuanmingense TaxID=108015 RepID=UPI001A7E3AD1
RIALLKRFWQARHPPRYAAFLTPSSPRFRHSSLHIGMGLEPILILLVSVEVVEDDVKLSAWKG